MFICLEHLVGPSQFQVFLCSDVDCNKFANQKGFEQKTWNRPGWHRRALFRFRPNFRLQKHDQATDLCVKLVFLRVVRIGCHSNTRVES